MPVMRTDLHIGRPKVRQRCAKSWVFGCDRLLGRTDLNVRAELLKLLDSSLGLGGRGLSFDDATPLLGAVPELDSMGVIAVLTALEDRLSLTVEDDEIDGSIFETFGSLRTFVEKKLGN